MHDGTSPLKRAQQHKARMLICTSRASLSGLTALPIHNALTLSISAFGNAFQFRLGPSPRPMHVPRVRCGCGALVDPPPCSPEPTSCSTLKRADRAPSSPPHGLRATIFFVSQFAGLFPCTMAQIPIFFVDLGARSCNPLGRPPPLSPAARELPDPTQCSGLVYVCAFDGFQI